MKTLKTCKTGCGKMKSGGAVKKVKKMAQGGQMYGIPQTGPTGPNIQGVDTMKRGGKVTTRKKMGMGGMHMMPDGTMMKDSMMKKGGSVKKMSKGGSLKPVSADQKGLAKLPTAVRNKMGYQKKGGTVKRK